MGGTYDDNIEIIITIGASFSEQNYEELLMILNDYLRHEIEHILQIIDPNREDITSKEGLTPFQYYTQPDEIEAQQAGFKRRADLEGKNIEDIIQNYLEYRQHVDKLEPEEKKEIFGRLTEEKDKRYNQPLEVGDVIELIYMDDPWNPISPLTRGIVMGFEGVPGGEDKILVTLDSRPRY